MVVLVPCHSFCSASRAHPWRRDVVSVDQYLCVVPKSAAILVHFGDRKILFSYGLPCASDIQWQKKTTSKWSLTAPRRQIDPSRRSPHSNLRITSTANNDHHLEFTLSELLIDGSKNILSFWVSTYFQVRTVLISGSVLVPYGYIVNTHDDSIKATRKLMEAQE